MQLLSGGLVVALCLTFGCWQPLSANPANPTAIEQAASANSATHEAVYTYRRTKHGFERCYHRNRFGTLTNMPGSAVGGNDGDHKRGDLYGIADKGRGRIGRMRPRRNIETPHSAVSNEAP